MTALCTAACLAAGLAGYTVGWLRRDQISRARRRRRLARRPGAHTAG